LPTECSTDPDAGSSACFQDYQVVGIAQEDGLVGVQHQVAMLFFVGQQPLP